MSLLLQSLPEQILGLIWDWLIFINSLLRFGAAWFVDHFTILWSNHFGYTSSSVAFGRGVLWTLAVMILLICFGSWSEAVKKFNRPVKVDAGLKPVALPSGAQLARSMTQWFAICVLAFWFGLNLIWELLNLTTLP